MALIKCPDCKREVSDKAMSCLSCGYPLEQVTTPEATAAATTVKRGKGIQLASLGAILVGIVTAAGMTSQGRVTFGALLILVGLIGVLAGKANKYLLAAAAGVLLGFIIFLLP